MMDVIAGNTQIAGRIVVQMLPQIKGGKLKALGVGSAKRIAALPDVPDDLGGRCAGLRGHELVGHRGAGGHAPPGDREAAPGARRGGRVERDAEALRGEGADPLQMSPRNSALHRAGDARSGRRCVKEAGIRPE
jgi:hypothetical protein